MNEIWKDITGYEGKYQVSNLGNVKSLNYRGNGKERILKPRPVSSTGYLAVTLSNSDTQKTLKVHRLVAQAFIENPNNKPCVDHINTNKTDNRADNLRWVTRKENNNNPITRERHSGEHRGKRVFCDGVIYNSAKQCAECYNVPAGTMSKWLNGKCEMPIIFRLKGLNFYFEDNEE